MSMNSIRSGALTMARLEVSGIDALLAGLDDMAESVPQLRDAILETEADVIEPALRRSISDEGLTRSFTLQRSISRRKIKLAGVPVIRIGPAGEHHRYLPSGRRSNSSGVVSAGYVGYIHEYGVPRRGIKARQWLKKGVEKSQSAAFDAADSVYDNFMKKHNL